MNSDPFELMMMSMGGYRMPDLSGEDDEDQDDASMRILQPANCRTS